MKNKSQQRAFAPADSKKVGIAIQLEGYLDHVDAIVGGWAWDPSQPDSPTKVEIYDGTTLLATVTAADFREDLRRAGKGNGKHGFHYGLPKTLQDGQSHIISARFANSRAQLIGSPKKLILHKR